MDETSPRVTPFRGKDAIWLAFLLALSAGYFSLFYDQRHTHADEGFFNYNGLRVLQGEMPSRDFTAYYTGMIYYYHAFLFRLWGVDLLSVRKGLFPVLLLIVALTWGMARQVLPRGWASVSVLATLAWGLPIWPASYPSWYGVVGALAAACLMMANDRPRPGVTLFACGVAAVLAFLFKQSCGIFIGAATLWAWVLGPAAGGNGDPETGGRRLPALVTLSFVCLLCTKSSLRNLDPWQTTVFLLPLWVHLAWGISRVGRGIGLRELRWRPLAGLALGVGLFLIPGAVYYQWHRALGKACYEIFVVPATHAFPYQAYSNFPPLSLLVNGWAWLPLVLGLSGRFLPARFRGAWWLWGIAGTALFALVSWRGSMAGLVTLAWKCFTFLFIAAPWTLLWWLSRERLPAGEEYRLRTLLVYAQVFSLISSHFADQAYMLYQAPFGLAMLGYLAHTAGRRRAGRGIPWWPVAVLPGILLGAGLGLGLDGRWQLWESLRQGRRVEKNPCLLDRERGRVMVSPGWQEYYRYYREELRRYALPGSPIFVYTSHPQFYFLYGYRNPTRYSVRDHFYHAPDSRAMYRELQEVMERERVSLIVDDRQFLNLPGEAGWFTFVRTRYRPVTISTFITGYVRTAPWGFSGKEKPDG